MTGLTKVTAGLGIAFDTTLIALVMAILLLFPTESLRRIEYGMLDRIEAFANESLLRRMSDEGPALSSEDMPDVVRGALESAFAEHQRWLAQWQSQVSRLGEVIGTDFEKALRRAEEKISEADSSRLQEYQNVTQLLQAAFHQADEASKSWQRVEQQSRTEAQNFLAAFARLEQSMSEQMVGLAAHLDRASHELEEVGPRGGDRPVAAAPPPPPVAAPPTEALPQPENLAPFEPADPKDVDLKSYTQKPRKSSFFGRTRRGDK